MTGTDAGPIDDGAIGAWAIDVRAASIDAAAPGARPPRGLYLHIPFCVSHCPYCDFVVVAGRAARGPSSRIDSFVAALEVELHLRADELDARWGPVRPPLQSVYLGGGTPSLLPAATLARLLGAVRSRYGVAADAEVTLEVNPGADERGDASAQVAAGVNRLSIGAQSFEVAELRTLGRRHGPADIEASVAGARSAGIPSISLDLLYDVPGQSDASWARTLDTALALEPDHLSIYALTLDDPDAEGITGTSGDHLPVAVGARRWRARAREAQDEDRAAAMYETADRRLASTGYRWYEISNWARPEHESRHNLAYWQGGTWEAVGPGAHAFDGAIRRWNGARLDAYIAALTPSDGTGARLPPGAAQASDDGDAWILRLRTRDGLPSAELHGERGPALRWGLAERLLAEEQDRLVLTRRGRLLSNELFARLV